VVEIIVTDAAWEDVTTIRNYIARDSERYAEEFIIGFFQRLNILHELPKAGRVVPEVKRDDLRELIFGSYRIIYRLRTEDAIGIVRVVHGARLLTTNITL